MSKRNSIVSATLAVAVLVLANAFGAYGQLQTGTQQACLNGLNKDGAAVAKTQGKENVGCLKNAGKGIGGSAQTCLGADGKGKVTKAKAKTTADDTKSCGSAPNFGFTGAAAVNAAAQQAELDLTADVFGPNLDPAVLSCSTNKAGCGCQQKIAKTLEGLAALKLSTFVGCKKAALKGGASSAAALAACVNDAGTAGSIAADTKGKIAKTRAGLNASITKSCDTPGVTASAFPGSCTALTGSALGACLDTRVECRVCQAINEMDGLFVNCDLFDDGIINASCASGTGPTPTPTPTLTPTPSPTATFQPGTIFQGALPRTIGHWTYQAMNGIAGGEAECNVQFPGSHVCTYADLSAAEALSELVAAVDVDGVSIDHFWAVVPAETDLNQCISAFPNVITRWAYATGHTASKGLFATLNAGTGDLGPVAGPVSCTAINIFSVGCCL